MPFLHRFYPFSLKVSIRQKLLLASSVLLIIPIIGYHYVQEIETFLQIEQQRQLLENARVISKVIESKPNLTKIFLRHSDNKTAQHRFIRPLQSPILLDGYKDDWGYYFSRTEKFIASQRHRTKTPLIFNFLSGHRQGNIYVFFEVRDANIVYREPGHNSVENCDHIVIATESLKGKFQTYVISTLSPGNIQAVAIHYKKGKPQTARIENRIKAVWQESASGYNVEVKIPELLLGPKVSFAVVDVNDPNQREIISVVTTGGGSSKNLSSLTIPEKSLHQILETFSIEQSRVWILNKKSQVMAVYGSIYDYDEVDSPEIDDGDSTRLGFREIISGLIRLVYKAILPQPSETFDDETSRASNLQGSEIDSALNGIAQSKWRLSGNEKVNVLRSVFPIYQKNQVVGAVAVERNSNSILLLQNHATELLMNASLIILLLSSVTLIIFASRLSFRIRRLRDEIDSATNDQGQITDKLVASQINDEIGDLQRAYTSMLIRLSDYNRYLESMASKLSHELRTPITVVKSSLENLELESSDSSTNAYIERARNGIDRLHQILTRMGEATRLEQSLKTEHKETVDLQKLVTSCVEGYQIANPMRAIYFELELEATHSQPCIIGCPDLIAQLLDKLINNALGFAEEDSAIVVHLKQNQPFIELSVYNLGPHLPEQMQDHLFDSMVSVREKRGEEPHLGLGLYIVRLIAEFHVGKPFARNRYHPDGVQIGVKFQQFQNECTE